MMNATALDIVISRGPGDGMPLAKRGLAEAFRRTLATKFRLTGGGRWGATLRQTGAADGGDQLGLWGWRA